MGLKNFVLAEQPLVEPVDYFGRKISLDPFVLIGEEHQTNSYPAKRLAYRA
jgi:hypothetical protein